MIAKLTVALCLLAAPAALAAERLNDEQIRDVIERIDRGFDEWKSGLERRNLDDATIKSAAGTIEVRRFLDDFEREIDHVKDRVKPESSAAPEVLALLRRGSDVERRARQQGASAASEWKALAGQLEILATAYGASWPVETADAQLGRMTDRELASNVDRLGQAADRLKGETDKAARQAKMDEAGRNRLKGSFDELSRVADDVESRLKDDRPASAEVDKLLGLVRQVGASTAALSLSPEGKSAWSTIQASVAGISRAFGVASPVGTMP
jgi:hypothetical protein